MACRGFKCNPPAWFITREINALHSHQGGALDGVAIAAGLRITVLPALPGAPQWWNHA